MDALLILFLAVVQGIGEFLPISSSGHLVVFMSLFEVLGFSVIPEDERLTLNILLHFGTLLAVFVVFRERIWRLFTNEKHLIPLLFVGTLPAVFVGFAIKLTVEDYLNSVFIAGACFLGTGLLLLSQSKMKSPEIGIDSKDMTYKQALIIGLFQALAILPGFSRSGFTICGGLICGLKRSEAAVFSFLLSIPVIGGGAILEMKDLAENNFSCSLGLPILLGGVVVSFLVGVFALRWLLNWLEKGKLHYFAYYLFAFGISVLAFFSLFW